MNQINRYVLLATGPDSELALPLLIAIGSLVGVAIGLFLI